MTAKGREGVKQPCGFLPTLKRKSRQKERKDQKKIRSVTRIGYKLKTFHPAVSVTCFLLSFESLAY